MNELVMENATTRPVSSLSEYLSRIEKTLSKSKNEFFFRGHAQIYPDLRPTLFRNVAHRRSESRIIHELLSEAPNEFEKDQYQFDRLVRAQHYGAPTRLLDISTNPLIALYFACQTKDQNNGQVIVIENKMTTPRYFLSDTVSCKSNLSKLTYAEIKALARTVIDLRTEVFGPLGEDAPKLRKLREDDPQNYQKFVRKFNSQDIACRLVQFIREEKSYFHNNIDPISLYEVEPVLPKKSNQRIFAQSGAFLIFGLSGTNHMNSRSFHRESIEIESSSKEKILKSLSTVDIAEHKIFPEIAEIGKSISKRFM